jgi:hypothetical protein
MEKEEKFNIASERTYVKKIGSNKFKAKSN